MSRLFHLHAFLAHLERIFRRGEKTIDNNVVLENLVIGVYLWRLVCWSQVIGRTKLCHEGVFHGRVGGTGAATLAPCPLTPSLEPTQSRTGRGGVELRALSSGTPHASPAAEFKPAPEHVSPVNALLSPPRAPKEQTKDLHHPVCRWCRVLGRGGTSGR